MSNQACKMVAFFQLWSWWTVYMFLTAIIIYLFVKVYIQTRNTVVATNLQIFKSGVRNWNHFSIAYFARDSLMDTLPCKSVGTYWYCLPPEFLK